MLRNRILAGLLLSALLTVRAQGPAVVGSTESTAGLTSVVFQTPMGVIRANFPSDMAAGDTISGTVTDDPAGATAEQKNENSATLSGYVIDTQDHRTTPRERRALWVIPPAVTAITVLLRDPPGNVVGRATVPVAPPAAPDPPAQPITPDDFDPPTVVSGSRSVPIEGRFTVTPGIRRCPLQANRPRCWPSPHAAPLCRSLMEFPVRRPSNSASET
jgi:hypothetical protein